MIKLFVSDLDGTLLNEKHQADARIEAGIRRVLANGRKFAIATGRDIEGVKRNPELWDIGCCIVSMNGALILDEHHQVIYKKGIPKPIIELFLERFPHVSISYWTESDHFMLQSKEAYLQQMKRNGKLKMFETRKEKDGLEQFLSCHTFGCSKQQILQEEILKINCETERPEDYRALEETIAQYSDSIVNAPFEPRIFEITQKDVNKANGIRLLAKQRGIDHTEIAVFGDGGNDVEMLRMFPHSFAMANGCEQAKAAAAHVIGSNLEYAVIRKMAELL